MSNSRVCLSCVSLSQRRTKAVTALHATYNVSPVGHVAAQANVKRVEADIWKHMKVCKD